MSPSNQADTNEIQMLLRDATGTLRCALATLAGGRIRVQTIAAAFASIRRVSETRVATISIESSSSSRGWKDYHSALQEWCKHLPRIHGWLLAEKARLEGRRAHAESVYTWIETNQQTR